MQPVQDPLQEFTNDILKNKESRAHSASNVLGGSARLSNWTWAIYGTSDCTSKVC